MFAAPVVKPRSSSLFGKAPSAAGVELSRIEGRSGIATRAPLGIPVFPQIREVDWPQASAGGSEKRTWAAQPLRIPSVRMQAKLEIGAADDPLEREADRIVDQVMSASGTLVEDGGAHLSATRQLSRKCSACAHGEEEHGKLLRKCADCEKKDKKKKVARRSLSSAGPTGGVEAPPTVAQVLRSPGEPLDRSLRNFLEPRFGHDFCGVRLHTDEKASSSARSVGALAYTVGRHIVFGSNQYSTRTAAGQRLLVHELAHTVQQGAADELGTEPTAAGSGAEGMLLQRQEAPGVHASVTPATPHEKSSPDVESRYRRSGLIDAANAVKRCREGNCSKVLTEAEAYSAYRTGKVSAGMSDAPPKQAGGPKTTLVAAGAVPALGGALAPASAPAVAGGEAVVESATAKAAVRWGLKSAAEVVVKEAAVVAPAAAAPAAAPAAGAATVAVPIALGVYLVVATVDLVGYTRFQVALQRQGYVILPNMLQVCISGCHHPDAPIDSSEPRGRGMPQFPDILDERALRDWIGPSLSAPTFPPVTTAAAPETTAKPVMPPGLSREKKKKWKRCEELYETYKKGTGAEAGSLASEIKEMRGKLGALSAKERARLCAKILQLIELVEQLIRERREYIDSGCDEFDWFRRGTTEAERRQAHEGEVDNVKAQEGNLRGALKKLQSEGVC